MANTTFNGPVRSENGFLEWDGTAWVPIQGGGGGSTAIAVTAANMGVYTELPTLAVGESVTYRVEPWVLDPNGSNDYAYFRPMPTAGADVAFFITGGVTVYIAGPVSYPDNVAVYTPNTGSPPGFDLFRIAKEAVAGSWVTFQYSGQYDGGVAIYDLWSAVGEIGILAPSVPNPFDQYH